jgi:hypothetical protein
VPGPLNDCVFTNTGAAGAPGVINNTVDGDITVNSLAYEATSGAHTTWIAPGRTLTITGGATNLSSTPALEVGMDAYAANNQAVRAAISGGGTLWINSPNDTMSVRQGFGSGIVGTRAALDMSGLNTLIANISRFQVGVESSATRRVSGVWYLARTNCLTLSQASGVNSQLTSGSPAFYLGHNTQAGNTNGSAVYLGITNGIFANYVVIGRGNQTNNLVAFNPVFLASNPTAYFRASDGASRVGLWTIGDNSSGSMAAPTSGTNDFSGGTVDAMVDNLFVGRGRDGTTTNTGIGVFTFTAGTVAVNTLRLGTMVDSVPSTNASGIGTANVNGSGVLIVNTVLELGHTNKAAPSTAAAVATTRGTLNINGGTVQATNVIGAGGLAAVNITSGTLDLEPAWASEPGTVANISTLTLGCSGGGGIALLTNATTISTTNTLAIAANGLLAGDTVIISPELLVNGGISPGAGGAGAMTNSGAMTLGGGGTYLATVQDAVVGGPGGGWSYIQANGGLDVESVATNPFTIRLRGTGGSVAHFTQDSAYDWPILGAAGITNFDAGRFLVDDSLWPNDLAGGYFYVHTNGGLLLSFTNNHSPVAGDAACYYLQGRVTQISIASLAQHWSDADGDPVMLLNVNTNSAGGNGNVTTDGTYIYYQNSNGGADTISYTVADVRTNPPASYRPGDTARTGTGVIRVSPVPGLQLASAGGQLVLSGSNGLPLSNYYLLTTTNVALPLAQWTLVAVTNAFDANGRFSVNFPAAGSACQFYLLQLPESVETGQ